MKTAMEVKIRKCLSSTTGILIFLFAGLMTIESKGQQTQSFGNGIQAKQFFSAVADKNNVVWFLSDAGIISFDGQSWTLHNNPKISVTGLKDLVYDPEKSELFLASPSGAIVAALPLNQASEIETYITGNSAILSENVVAVAVGKGSLKWAGTDKGISAVQDKTWLKNSYERNYPGDMFKNYPITSMATSPSGDTLYAGTAGAGVARVYRNDVDGISGASEYAEWGPIIMPSDNVQSVYITSNGTQWVGTDKGVAQHTGYETLENWTAYTTEDGLADNFVQAIISDSEGKMWFGTKNGLSVFDGTKWTTYNTGNGLISNNVLSIAIDGKGGVWLGTDNGISYLNSGKFINYQ